MEVRELSRRKLPGAPETGMYFAVSYTNPGVGNHSYQL